MARTHVGRHRAPGFNPLNEIADIATRSAQPAMKASAVVVASGGLVATFAIPASAAPGADSTAAAAGSAVASSQVVSGAVSVAAPALDAAAAPTFGVIGFTAAPAAKAAPAPVTIQKIAQPVAAPAPAPAAAATTTARASRTATRTTTAAAAPAAAPAPAAPAPAAPAPTGGIIGIAAGLSGIPYVYGGTTTRGFDCSGFTGYVYRLAGISIPRVASAQQAAATKVSNPAPGDLIFFGSPAYHVGIYAGNGMMYDAQHPGTVTGLHSIWTTRGVSYGRF